VTTAKMPPCYGTPRPARVRPDRGRTSSPPRARHTNGVTPGKSRRVGCGFDLGKARGPKAARDLGRRGVGRRAGVDAKGESVRAWARSRGVTSRCKARLARFYFVEPQFEQE
jgi:hypothetical protein